MIGTFDGFQKTLPIIWFHCLRNYQILIPQALEFAFKPSRINAKIFNVVPSVSSVNLNSNPFFAAIVFF